MNKKFVIPSSFQLHGITFSVVYDDSLIAKNDNTGEASYRENKIVLQSVMKGVPITVSRQEQVFCHELVHHIFNAMRASKLRDDENIVDLFASLLHQALSSAEYQPNVSAENNP